MNDQSSRSHAIFTIYLQQQRQAAKVDNPFHLNNDENGEGEDGGGGENNPARGEKDPGDLEQLTAKFHFVDLAGKKTFCSQIFPRR